MSIPITCHEKNQQCQDILMHLLYSGGSEALLKSLITQSIRNITEEHKDAHGVRDALAPYRCPSGPCSLALLRAIFFVLLHQDSRMRTALCEKRFFPALPPLCPYKACRLYDQLGETVAEWAKNETVDLLQFSENLKDAYLVS
jgi:hypothetical protein